MKGQKGLKGLKGLLLFALIALTACEKKAAPPFAAPPSAPASSTLADMLEHPRFTVPHFTLTERSGQPFDSASLGGKIYVADFFFATCLGICPALTSEMQKVHAATAELRDVAIVSISTDERDTPEVLRDYAARYKADARWSFLTGPKDTIFHLSKDGFKLALADATAIDAKEKFVHSGMMVLVDRHGRIRGYYDAVGPDAEANRQRLIRDLRRIHAEK